MTDHGSNQLRILLGDEVVDVETPAKPAGTFADLLSELGHPLNTRCGQRGKCDGCRVDLDGEGGQWQSRRACELKADPLPASRVRLPETSRQASRMQVVEQFHLGVPWAHAPVEHTAGCPLGLAVDIGTTTVAVLLIDLSNGDVVGRGAGFNRQAAMGDNVLTRINHCMTDGSALKKMQRLVVRDTLGPLIGRALAESEHEPSDIGVACIAANTTMLHLFAGVDPTPMGVSPFTPAFVEPRTLDASALGLPFRGPCHLLPSASAYLGADAVVGLLTTGIAYDPEPAMFLDIGTNGEVIARSGDRLVGCTTAAGPAFEGAGLHAGMHATRGAIAHAHWHPNRRGFKPEVIGAPDAQPQGICGSGYIDLIAALSARRCLTPTGRFVPDALEAQGLRCHALDEGIAVQVAGQRDAPVLLAETDVASLLQAKAAIAAGIETLLDRLGRPASEMTRLALAGGFGLHLHADSAIGMGLTPGFTADQLQVFGNTALAGAMIAMLDRSLLAELVALRQRIEVIELNLDPQFEDRFLDAMMLPVA